jgi:hypothetical protein
MRCLLVSFALAVAPAWFGVRPAVAGEITPVLDAHVSSGVDPDSTVIGQLMGGGMLVFDRFRLAVDGHVSFSGFLRLNDDRGIAARSFAPLNLGVRYGFRNERFHGLYATAGAGFGFLGGSPKERKVEDPAICATAAPRAGETTSPSSCTFRITQQANIRTGLGWGFASGPQTTVGVRLDLVYFAFNIADGEDQIQGAPAPAEIDRPQGTIALMVGLEFMHWR